MLASELLQQHYDMSMTKVGSRSIIDSDINESEKSLLDVVLATSESAKGVLTVVITSLVYKILHPAQDIRNHQEGIPNGYSGRSFDTKYITPFLKQHKFPAMAESGWLTRSLENKVPYDLNYTGSIKPQSLKTAFLSLLDRIQTGADPIKYLSYMLQGLIIKRNRQQIELAKPISLSIKTILDLLKKYFHAQYVSEGASRLPVLALYAIYQCLISQTKRFENKRLLPLESHTSADTRSGRIGDIDIVDINNREFEAVEIKFGIPLTTQLVLDAFEKFKTTPVQRFYILSTASEPNPIEFERIHGEILRIKNIHGCQLIVNGVMDSLKYYLRLLDNTFEFVDHFVNLIEVDKALKFEHKEMWNRIIGELN